MLPETAPVGTTTLIVVSVLDTMTAPVVLPEVANVTDVASARCAPANVTVAPTGACVGVTPDNVGADGVTVNVPLTAVPPADVTLTAPVVAPEGTVAVIFSVTAL